MTLVEKLAAKRLAQKTAEENKSADVAAEAPAETPAEAPAEESASKGASMSDRLAKIRRRRAENQASENTEAPAETKAAEEPKVKAEATEEPAPVEETAPAEANETAETQNATAETEEPVSEAVEAPTEVPAPEEKTEEPVDDLDALDVTDTKTKKPAKAKKATKTTKTAAKKKAETSTSSDSNDFITIQIDKKNANLDDVIAQIGSSYDDEEWIAFREDVTQKLYKIRPLADMNPGSIRYAQMDLADVHALISLRLAEYKGKLSALENPHDGEITAYRRIGEAQGSNVEVRKAYGIAAMVNADRGGEKVNFVAALAALRDRVEFLNGLMERIKFINGIFISFNGTLKLEKDFAA